MGFNLAVFLSKRGHQITVLDNLVRRGSETNVAGLRKMGITFVHGDIRSPEDFLELPADADALIECSAQPSVVAGYDNPVYDFRTNVEGAVNCLEFCRRTGLGMIFLSTSRVYPADKINAVPRIERETRWDWDPDMPLEDLPEGFDPVHGIGPGFSMDGPSKTLYGASKAAADLLCREYADAFGFPLLINRCGVIAGKGQFGVVNQGWFTFWAISCLFERPLTYFGYKGKQVRDIIFIEDLCELLEIQINRLPELSGKVWNVGGGRESSASLVEATDLMERLLSKKMTISVSDEGRKADVIIYISDNTEITRDLNWQPRVTMEQGAEKIAAWVRDNKTMLESAGL